MSTKILFGQDILSTFPDKNILVIDPQGKNPRKYSK